MVQPKPDSNLLRKRKTGLEAYVQKDLFDKEVLDAYIADFPIGDTKITYEVKDPEDKDLEPGMGRNRIEPNLWWTTRW